MCHSQTPSHKGNQKPQLSQSTDLQPVQDTEGQEHDGQIRQDVGNAHPAVGRHRVSAVAFLDGLVPLERKGLANGEPDDEARDEPVAQHDDHAEPRGDPSPPVAKDSQVQNQDADLGKRGRCDVEGLGGRLDF